MNCVNPKCATPLPDGAQYCYACGRKQSAPKRRKRVHANGQGCVYQLPNKKWRAEKTLGYRMEPPSEGSPPGTLPKKKRITVTQSNFRTRSEALAALPNLTARTKAERTRPLSGTTTAKKGEQITLKELYDQWEPTHKKGRSTLNCYRSGFRLFSPLWDVPMCAIDIDDLQECMDDTDLGRRTKENGKTCLGLVYKYGIPRNCIPKDRNLAPFLVINAAGGNHKPGFSSEELEAVRKLAVAGSQAAKYVYCHCYLGFRPSGLLKLKITDYNPTEKALTGGIKTEAGIGRTVTVSPKIQPYLDEIIGGRSEGYIFGDSSGAQLSIEKYRANFYSVLEAAGIDNPVDDQGRHRLTPHSCRHTFGTLMKRVDAPDKDKLELMGHTSTSQLHHYQDVSYEDLRKITDAI